MKKWIVVVALVVVGSVAQAADFQPFFYSGDGVLVIQTDGAAQKIRFRDKDGGYNTDGLARINKIFGAHYGDGVKAQNMQVRFLEFLNYLQNHYNNAPFKILSGYRSPKYNQGLRNQGRLAAQTSMHMEGSAADIIFPAVLSSEIFPFIKGLNCCGVGYYHGNALHVDTGPPRYWDETTSGTEKKEPQQNEKIIVQSIYDRYHAGDDIVFELMRVTDYPVETPVKWELVAENGGKSVPISVRVDAISVTKGCQQIPDRAPGHLLMSAIPADLPLGKYRSRLTFCSRTSDKMPASITSNVIEIIK